MMFLAATTFLALQDIVENQVNARRVATVMNGMQAPVIDFVDLSFGKAKCLSAHIEEHTVVGDDRYVYAMCMRQ